MKVSENHPYAHKTSRVYSLFTDAKEITAKQRALGARKINVFECDKGSDGAAVRFVRELPADVPGLLARFLQPWNTVEQAEEWQALEDGRFRCKLSIDIANVPVDVKGTLTLKPVDDGCVNQVRLNVDCGIPFVGKSLAEFVAKDCQRLVADEFDYITERLASG